MSWSPGNGPCENTGSRVKPKSANLLGFIQHQDIHPLVGPDKMTPTRRAQAHQIPTPKTPDQSGQVHAQTTVYLGLEEGQGLGFSFFWIHLIKGQLPEKSKGLQVLGLPLAIADSCYIKRAFWILKIFQILLDTNAPKTTVLCWYHHIFNIM